ncbi:MAG TPA: tetratricopeptide repeat protein, partial [Steroidobacteraceae bacterium]|nr:tetratricopeptide repeat protein [Steroidobacteraceae bacterium]
MEAQQDLNSIGAAPVATAEVALKHAVRLLDRSPELALRQADEVLRSFPGHPHARLLQGAAHRRAGRIDAALAVLEPLADEQPAAARVHLELAAAQSEAGRFDEAIVTLRRVLKFAPESPDAWRSLADQFDRRGDAAAADEARTRAVKAATRDPRLRAAADALVANDLPSAEALLREHLQAHPTDVAALRMLAEVAGRLRRFADSESLLVRCVELAPSFDAARQNYASLLNRQGKAADALPQVERLLEREPRNPAYRNLQAAIYANLGDFDRTIAIYQSVLADFPRQPKIWTSCGHALKTARRLEESIGAYRRAIAMAPTLGEAYWSLANLKTFRFAAEDVAAMRAALARDDLADEDRLHFEFALGKALEDEAAYAEAFAHFASGNALRKRMHPYAAGDTSRFVHRSIAVQDRA